MDMRTVHPSPWFGAGDFDGVGKELTIGQVMMQQVGAEYKPVIYFQGQEKALVINPTNNKLIIAMLGWDSNDWIGQKIVLFSYSAMFNGQPQLRIGVRQADGVAPPATPERGSRHMQMAQAQRKDMDDEVPF